MRCKTLLGTLLLCCAATWAQSPEPASVHWHFDEGSGTTVADATGMFKGTIHGARWGAGRLGDALVFDGRSRVEIPDDEAIRIRGPISVEAWIRPTSLGGYQMIARKEKEYQLRINGAPEGNLSAFFVFLDGRWEPRTQNLVPRPGRWHHIVGVWTGRRLQVWLDGELASRDRLGKPAPTTNPLIIGSGFSGVIDELSIYHRALRWDEVLARYSGLELATAKVSQPAFDFSTGAQGWAAVRGVSAFSARRGRLSMVTRDRQPLICSPPLKGDADRYDFLALRMRVDKGVRGEVWLATDRGSDTVRFELRADGQWHTYNISLSASPVWQSRIHRLGLRPTDAEAAHVDIDAIAVRPEPAGIPDIVIKRFDLRDTLPRAGHVCRAVAVLQNFGSAVRQVKATVVLPAGLTLAEHKQASKTLARLACAEQRLVSWRLRAERPGTFNARVEVSAPGASPAIAEARWQILPSLHLAAADYVPRPEPVRGPFEVGIKYFPGWRSSTAWARIMPYIERTPALGWYREGLPEVMDWHIKWALEHGVTFWLFDWYWVSGHRHLEHALHQGLFKARYGNLIKFAIHWANHNPPNTTSRDDLAALARYWIDNYFKRPNYLRIDGKPVVFIFVPSNISRDLGGSAAQRAAWERVREQCRAAGLGGLYLVGRSSGTIGDAERIASEGYDAIWASSNLRAGVSPSVLTAPMEAVWRSHQQLWSHLVSKGPLPVIPMVWTGWDSRPWHGTRAYVLEDYNPDGFGRALAAARRAVLAGTGPRICTVWAWNEWGEGSYAEPCRQWGFGYLDAVRSVFTDAPQRHTDIVPADVGLPLYEFSPPKSATAWEFNRDGDPEGWDGGMGVRKLQVHDGCLHFVTASHDPAIFGPPISVVAKEYPYVIVVMKTSADDLAQLYWTRATVPESEQTVYRFNVIGDGQFHTYVLPVHEVRTWRGIITRLRLDPANKPAVEVAIDSIKLSPSPAAP